MEYMLKVLDLEKEIDRLKVVDKNHIKYIDSKRRVKDLDNFARKISEMDLRESDRLSLQERVEEYKNKIENYEKSAVAQKSKKSGVSGPIVSFLFGIFFYVLGDRLKELYKLYKSRELKEKTDYIYEKLSGVESTDE